MFAAHQSKFQFQAFDPPHPPPAPFPPATLSQEREVEGHGEPQSSGPSETEVALQEALSSMQEEKDALMAQYQAQVTMDTHKQNLALRDLSSIISTNIAHLSNTLQKALSSLCHVSPFSCGTTSS